MMRAEDSYMKMDILRMENWNIITYMKTMEISLHIV